MAGGGGGVSCVCVCVCLPEEDCGVCISETCTHARSLVAYDEERGRVQAVEVRKRRPTSEHTFFADMQNPSAYENISRAISMVLLLAYPGSRVLMK